jgi:hypothetical protein
METKVCPKCFMRIPSRAIECTTNGCSYVFVPESRTHVNPTYSLGKIGRTYPVATQPE